MIDPEAVVRTGLAALRDLPRLFVSANVEGRKKFVRAFVGGITVRPDAGVLDLQIEKFPALAAGNFSCDVVAGARHEPVQMDLKPLERFLRGDFGTLTLETGVH